jgi:hypothetical protein
VIVIVGPQAKLSPYLADARAKDINHPEHVRIGVLGVLSSGFVWLDPILELDSLSSVFPPKITQFFSTRFLAPYHGNMGIPGRLEKLNTILSPYPVTIIPRDFSVNTDNTPPFGAIFHIAPKRVVDEFSDRFVA